MLLQYGMCDVYVFHQRFIIPWPKMQLGLSENKIELMEAN